MPKRDTRKYPYTAPVQKHGKGRGKSMNKQDRSREHISSVKGAKSDRQSGTEGTVGRSNAKGMAKKPKGTPITGAMGRESRARSFKPELW